MSEVKMGTQYVREMAEVFKKTAADCKFPDIKSKLVSLADEMEQLAGKLYFKTQKGTEDMQALAGKMAGLDAKIGSMDQAAAESFLKPVFAELDATINHVKTMKVRMT